MPGGRLLITCPHVYILHEEPFDFWRATLHGLKFYAARHGLEEIESEQLGGAFDVFGTMCGANVDAVRPARPVILDRAIAKAIQIGIRAVYLGLRRGWVQKHCVLESRYRTYLINVIYLRRPA
jgi:hypothetical protein